MIAYLEGTVASNELDYLILDVGGVGYGITASIEDRSQFQVGAKVKLYIYEHIREDAHDLYGFSKPASKELFEQLISVKNVGPKVAMAVLGIGPENIVRSAIANGDVKLLQSAKGVGKRAAEQMVVELRDKVGLATGGAAESIVNRTGVNMADEALQALVALGYTDYDAQQVLDGIDKNLPTEERIKLALKGNK